MKKTLEWFLLEPEGRVISGIQDIRPDFQHMGAKQYDILTFQSVSL